MVRFESYDPTGGAGTKGEDVIEISKDRELLFIGGRWTEPHGGAWIEVESPTTEEIIGRVPRPSVADGEAAVAAAREAFDEGPWPHLEPGERAACLERLADGLDARAEAMALVLAAELGAPLPLADGLNRSGTASIRACAALADQIPFEEERRAGADDLRIIREPVGVVLGIVPWNAPLALAGQKIGSALMAGCTLVLKPAIEDPLVAYALADAAAEAGFPDGVISILPADRDVGEAMVRDPRVDHISFTGSSAVGRRIMGIAAERIARVSLELGGKSAAIVLDDADLDQALPFLVRGGARNTGQVCVALTRLLVSKNRHDEVVGALRDAFEGLVVGDPLDPATEMGPLVSRRQRRRVEDYLQVGVAEGAVVVTGGGRPAGLERGWFVEPTIFDGVTSEMRIAREEIFGPVVAVLTYEDEDDAVRIANDSAYGLAGSIFSADIDRALALARRIRTGTLAINGAGPSTVEPIGGFKQSGLGRECGVEGILELLEIKQVKLPHAATAA
jgi:acyl-CoA reductase-like NAD-dependent aldehyde dehydrogenase